jgi:exodeoxyribonuclease VII large subunit
MRVLDVFEVTAYLKELIEFDPILNDVWVRGEISNLSVSAAGHSYFSLAGDSAQLNCVLFRGNRTRLMAPPRNGDAVLAHGRFSIYESRGQYQLVVDNVAPEGIGLLQLQFEETRRRLEAEGLFALDRKRPLPEMPRTIGVVTSEQGAVWHDIQHVIARRFPLVRLVLSPSAVQGPNAPEELISALQLLEESGEPDVIIVGRGGGSMEDLAGFSDERLARAIFRCRIPVVSAVGHETDTCIADLVADVRAPTPSAAAELCVPDQRALLAHLDECVRDVRSYAVQKVRTCRVALKPIHSTMAYSSPITRIQRAQQDVDILLQQSTGSALRALDRHRLQVLMLRDRASLLNPRDVLRRGYAVVSANGGVGPVRITSAEEVAKHDRVILTFSNDSIETRPVRRSHDD